MPTKSIDYAILYNSSNPPLDIFKELDQYPRESPYHRTIVLIGNDKSNHSPSSKYAKKLNFYSFSGTVPLNVFMTLKKKIDEKYPNLDVHLVRNDESPINFSLFTLDETAIPVELIEALGTFFTDYRELGERMENQAQGKIPGTVYERTVKKLKQTHPNVVIEKNL